MLRSQIFHHGFKQYTFMGSTLIDDEHITQAWYDNIALPQLHRGCRSKKIKIRISIIKQRICSLRLFSGIITFFNGESFDGFKERTPFLNILFFLEAVTLHTTHAG